MSCDLPWGYVQSHSQTGASGPCMGNIMVAMVATMPLYTYAVWV